MDEVNRKIEEKAEVDDAATSDMLQDFEARIQTQVTAQLQQSMDVLRQEQNQKIEAVDLKLTQQAATVTELAGHTQQSTEAITSMQQRLGTFEAATTTSLIQAMVNFANLFKTV